MEYKPKTIAPFGCAVLVVLGVWLGGAGIIYLAAKEFGITRQLDWWLFGLYAIPLVYAGMKLSIYVFPILNTFSTRKWFIIGRIESYLLFPFFAYLLALLAWYFTKNTIIVSAVGVIGGWLLTKALHKTLYAHEFI